MGVRAPGWNVGEDGCALAYSAALSVGKHGMWQRGGAADALWHAVLNLACPHLAEREVTPCECIRRTGFVELCPAIWADHSRQYQFHRFLRGRKLAKSAGGGQAEKSRGRVASPRPPARLPSFGVQRGWSCRSGDAPFLQLREWRRLAWGLMQVMLGMGVRAPGWNVGEDGCATACSAVASVGRHGMRQRGGGADARWHTVRSKPLEPLSQLR